VQPSTVAGGLEAVAAEVEEAHGVAVEVVVVGDCPTSPPLQALVAAAREALVNAAKHAGVDTVSLYAEVTPAASRSSSATGAAASTPTRSRDRFGVSQSVVGRMERHGGRAVVRSTPGSGTEVRLEVSRP
jgi:signal transduction histidine kinase